MQPFHFQKHQKIVLRHDLLHPFRPTHESVVFVSEQERKEGGREGGKPIYVLGFRVLEYLSHPVEIRITVSPIGKTAHDDLGGEFAVSQNKPRGCLLVFCLLVGSFLCWKSDSRVRDRKRFLADLLAPAIMKHVIDRFGCHVHDVTCVHR